jgi:hypothetical protein
MGNDYYSKQISLPEFIMFTNKGVWRNGSYVTTPNCSVSLQTSIWITPWVGLKHLLTVLKETFIFCYQHFLNQCSKTVTFVHFIFIFIYRHTYIHFVLNVQILCLSKQGTVIDPLDTKLLELYLKNQFVPRSKHTLSRL